MNEEVKGLIEELRSYENNKLTNIRCEREFLNGKQEGLQEAISTAVGIIMQHFNKREEK